MLKILSATVACLLIALLVLFIWAYRFSGPKIKVREHEGSVVLENVFSGEYYFGISDVCIEESGTGRVIFEASQGTGMKVTRINFGTSVNLVAFFNDAGWNHSIESDNFELIPGNRYRVKLIGNNGFGYFNPTSRDFIFPKVK